MEQTYEDAIAKLSSDLSGVVASISPKYFVEVYLRLHPDESQSSLASRFGMKPQAFSKLLLRPTGSFNELQKQTMANLIAETDFSALLQDFYSFFQAALKVQFFKISEKVIPLLARFHAEYFPDNRFTLRILDSVLDYQDVRNQKRRLYYFDKSFIRTMDAELRGFPPHLQKADILCTNNKELAFSSHPRIDFYNAHLYPDQVILFSENYDEIIEFFNC